MSEGLARAETTHAIIDAARARVSDDVWDYVAGGAETETTMFRNRESIDSLALRPRVLRDVSTIDASSTLLGHKLRIPVVLAPIGALELITPAGGVASARAAQLFGVMGIISTVAEPNLEAVAESSSAPLASQLYIRGDAGWVDRLIDRVVGAGYVAVTLTVDSAYYGHREREIRRGFAPPGHRESASGRTWQTRVDWDWLDRMRDHAGLPMIVKGIQTAQDAELAVEHGTEVVYVSNHGGRQLDHGEATIDILREVVDAVGGRAQIVVDGGFLRGVDVLKAIALGADAVGLGRLQALALAAGGEGALVRVLELLEDEILIAMGLLGVTKVAELDSSFVSRAAAMPAASPLQAAFPLDRADWPPR